jgi:hypothetical protein
MAASEGLSFDAPSGRVTMHGRQVDKDMYLAQCKGTNFEVFKTIKGVKSGTACRPAARTPRSRRGDGARARRAGAERACSPSSVLALLSLGLAVIFGLLGVLNLAHGELVMMGAYCAYVVQVNGLPFVAAVPLAIAVCGVLGYVVERWLVRRSTAGRSTRSCSPGP